ncbi:16S rRNA (guanine(527)-N(7))-methyltransferase RsmG [Candidatus Nitrotoga sp. AM1P]|uniref:16S rRNA (guanine(527)-N(7))-methyltransferase RsmG n=1 Tax=Candidatus Nitrotoga sp. AM1P TaxID=2559597 RepID=UPI0010BB700D|nr:16S rRNA (guanine(527)-N(7))-methyltransferase RsmG [Candidatus Nitrotoga sp. AM1P]BBJ23920.1 ribosomal RNA small subunit methyltransferase G [Candidatus Nitrotoga sp. AM1P]
MNQADELVLGITQLGLDVAPEVQRKLFSYLEMLQKWNRVYNLTAIRQPEQMISGHLLDSLAVLPHLWPGRWLDVGCGAGLPGIILALMRPEWTFALLDSNSKKTSFVQQVKIELELHNVNIYCTRVEAWQAGEKFDGIISRAFAETAKFVTLTRHLLDQKGRWIAMKGVPQQELERLPNDISVEQIIPLQVPGLAAARCLIMLKST